MRKIQKPHWLIYAEEVRTKLDNLPSRTTEKRFDQAELEAWKTAVREKDYTGTLDDWQYLMRRLGKRNARHSGR